MLPRLVQYLVSSLLYPQARKLGFLDMGMGIEMRSHKLRRFWQPHFELCREFQRKWLGHATDASRVSANDAALMVLGAGHLYDADLDFLAQRFPNIALVDANPVVRSIWRRAQRNSQRSTSISMHTGDVSGLLEHWNNRLTAQLAAAGTQHERWENALRDVRDAAVIPAESKNILGRFAEGRPLSVLSLNLLSQIPLVWQHNIEKKLEKRFGKQWLCAHEQEWLEAFFPGARLLVDQHFADLAALNPESILLLTDVQYAYYKWPQKVWPSGSIEAPFKWDARSGWTIGSEPAPITRTQAPSCEVLSALYGLDLENAEVRKELLPDYSTKAAETWLWHILPFGAEGQTRGIIHRVCAFLFTRNAV